MNRVKSAAALTALVLVLCLSLSGCGKEKLAVDIDDLAADLLAGVSFSEELAPLERDVAGVLYDLPDDTNAVVYLGSGATAEELSVFDSGSEEAAAALAMAVEERRLERVELYSDYAPAESEKLEKAVLIQRKQYVIYCVSPDDNAKSVIEEALAG